MRHRNTGAVAAGRTAAGAVAAAGAGGGGVGAAASPLSRGRGPASAARRSLGCLLFVVCCFCYLGWVRLGLGRVSFGAAPMAQKPAFDVVPGAWKKKKTKNKILKIQQKPTVRAFALATDPRAVGVGGGPAPMASH